MCAWGGPLPSPLSLSLSLSLFLPYHLAAASGALQSGLLPYLARRNENERDRGRVRRGHLEQEGGCQRRAFPVRQVGTASGKNKAG